jgi:hypothetical protein
MVFARTASETHSCLKPERIEQERFAIARRVLRELPAGAMTCRGWIEKLIKTWKRRCRRHPESWFASGGDPPCPPTPPEPFRPPPRSPRPGLLFLGSAQPNRVMLGGHQKYPGSPCSEEKLSLARSLRRRANCSLPSAKLRSRKVIRLFWFARIAAVPSAGIFRAPHSKYFAKEFK